MAMKTVAHLLVDVLTEAGVKRVYGVSGDSLNGITDSIRSTGVLDWVHMRHEETAAFAAGAEAHLTGRLAVCAGSCGPGNLHLINGLYDCHRSRVPVLAIAAQIPSAELGSGYFQETRPEHLFAQCSHYCELVSHPEQMPRVLEIAIQTAVSRRGVSVVALPGAIAPRPAVVAGPRVHFHDLKPEVRPADEEIATLAEVLNGSRKTTILGGRLRRRARGARRARSEAAGSDRARHTREGVHRVRQPLRRRHDRPGRILVRVSRDDELRGAADDRRSEEHTSELQSLRH